MSVQNLLTLFEDILRNKLKIGKAVLFRNDNQWKCLFHYSLDGKSQVVDFPEGLLIIRDIGTIPVHTPELKSEFEIVVPVYHKEKPLAFLLLGDIDESLLQLSTAIKHLPFVQTLTNIIIVAMENKKLFRENLKQVAMARELELASEMQHMLVPEQLPDNNFLSVAAVYLPQQQVGGDYFDFIPLNDDEFLICMCDVSGKGMSAALLMSNFQANLHALSSVNSNLPWLMQQLNKKVCQGAKGEKYITAFIARYHVPSHKLEYLNAGHHAPVLLTGDRIHLLEAQQPGLGMIDDPVFPNSTIHEIEPNSLLVCYTDGVVELENEEGNFFGTDKLINLVKSFSHERPKQLNQKIILELESFKEKLPYSDDVTLLSCRFF